MSFPGYSKPMPEQTVNDATPASFHAPCIKYSLPVIQLVVLRAEFREVKSQLAVRKFFSATAKNSQRFKSPGILYALSLG